MGVLLTSTSSLLPARRRVSERSVAWLPKECRSGPGSARGDWVVLVRGSDNVETRASGEFGSA